MKDWSISYKGYANDSHAFHHMSDRVEEIIKNEATMLIAGRADVVAKRIMAEVAHTFKLRLPTDNMASDIFGKCPVCIANTTYLNRKETGKPI